jgi:hypothetical protein
MMRAFPALGLSLPRWRAESLRIPADAPWLGAITLLALALRLVWVFYTNTLPLGGDRTGTTSSAQPPRTATACRSRTDLQRDPSGKRQRSGLRLSVAS